MKSHKILDLIGNTPLVESVNLVKNKNVKLLLKLEGNNPGGSVKDRAAYNMIASAIEIVGDSHEPPGAMARMLNEAT